MNDEHLIDAWTALEPAPGLRDRIRARVFDRLDACETPLAVEWLGLFRATPFSASALVAVCAASLATATPVIWVARALL